MTKNLSTTISGPPQQVEAARSAESGGPRRSGPGRAQPGRSGMERARLYRLGVWTALNPRKVLAVWLVLLACAVVSGSYFTSHLTGNNDLVTGSESDKAAQLMKAEFPDTPRETAFVVVHSKSVTTDDKVFGTAVAAAVIAFHASPDVMAVSSPYSAPQQLISSDRHTALVPVSLNGSDRDRQKAAKPLQDLTKGLAPGQIDVYFTGSSPLAAAGVEQGAADLARAESIGLPAAGVVLLIAFGSLVAASIPLLLGILAVVAAFGVLGVVSIFAPFDVFAQTAVSMVGIALGIDYSLFIVTRFREELARMEGNARQDRAAAVGRTLATAGSAVLFSGTTVVVSLAGLWLVRSPKVHSMAMGMTAAVVVMMLISVTLLPAILGMLGRRINRLALPWARRSLAEPDPEHSRWAKLASMVMRRPVAVAILAMTFLGALTVPAFGLRYGVDLGADAVADSRAGQGYALVSDSFAPGLLAPINVVVSRGDGALSDSQLQAISQFGARAATKREVTEVRSITTILGKSTGGPEAPTAKEVGLATENAGPLDDIVSKDGSASIITVQPRLGAGSKETALLVKELRADAQGAFAAAGLTSHVGGGPAAIVDVMAESSRALPVVIGAVLAASWLLLLFAFRSFLLPFKAILMNLLTSGATFGVAVLVFQGGYGAQLLGVDRTGFIQVILPLFAFALVFGLSMDYEVFILSRIQEEWERTGDNTHAVRVGITQTASVVTAAATIMVVVFSSFMFTRILEIKQMGFMLGLAILIDATVVRLLLVPALMRLMGSRSWWLPRWMGRLLPRTPHSDPSQHSGVTT
jgi:putative drug exporter of the RND superfamily